jgi:F-type H+-transporting ATPase subunit b
MIHLLLISADSSSGIGALGISVSAFLIQLITFVLVFLLLQRFAFKPIINMLQNRRKVIDEGVKAGEELAKARERFDDEVTKTLRDARDEADHIIETGQKEARDILRDAESAARRRSDAMMADAEQRLAEEGERAKRKLEKDVVGMVSEATEAIIEEKVDAAKDAALIEKTIRRKRP